MVKKEKIYSDLNTICEKQVDKTKVKVFTSMQDVIDHSSSIVILTDWREFKEFNWKELIGMPKQKIKIYDFRCLGPFLAILRGALISTTNNKLKLVLLRCHGAQMVIFTYFH